MAIIGNYKCFNKGSKAPPHCFSNDGCIEKDFSFHSVPLPMTGWGERFLPTVGMTGVSREISRVSDAAAKPPHHSLYLTSKANCHSDRRENPEGLAGGKSLLIPRYHDGGLGMIPRLTEVSFRVGNNETDSSLYCVAFGMTLQYVKRKVSDAAALPLHHSFPFFSREAPVISTVGRNLPPIIGTK